MFSSSLPVLVVRRRTTGVTGAGATDVRSRDPGPLPGVRCTPGFGRAGGVGTPACCHDIVGSVAAGADTPTATHPHAPPGPPHAYPAERRR